MKPVVNFDALLSHGVPATVGSKGSRRTQRRIHGGRSKGPVKRLCANNAPCLPELAEPGLIQQAFANTSDESVDAHESQPKR